MYTNTNTPFVILLSQGRGVSSNVEIIVQALSAMILKRRKWSAGNIITYSSSHAPQWSTSWALPFPEPPPSDQHEKLQRLLTSGQQADTHLVEQINELLLGHAPAQLPGLCHAQEDRLDLRRALGAHKCDA